MEEKTSTQTNSFSGKPLVYFNGFNVYPSLVDFQLYLYVNGDPYATLNMSYVTAKNLANKILSSIEDYEKSFETKIDEYEDLSKRLEALNTEKK